MGLVTDVCLKRKVRNYVQVAKGLEDGYDIFIKEKAILNTLIDKAHDDSEVKMLKIRLMHVVLCARTILMLEYLVL